MGNKLLIIDDDPILQDQLAWALKQDFELTRCSDLEGGLKAAARERLRTQLDRELADPRAWVLQPDGSYRRDGGDAP